ncbi:hypothetical protein GCM10010358_73410 [Streptomyces minutiscleroticus]|uniref:Uncharacterized protein n=1 Tax=Streptomyces minutiscleroticus TaxID=68238 RepID=A0A918NZX9_9ACTN|nr:hypothetical protein GCM10010358_73410 [Streptomyces minutiscleroticus]
MNPKRFSRRFARCLTRERCDNCGWQGSDIDSRRSARQLARGYWDGWGRMMFRTTVRGACSATGNALVSFIIWWLQSK